MMKSHGNAQQLQGGFALLFVLFLVALVIVGGSVALLNRLTQGQREKEAETIWRGEQYDRAIGLYYRKFGRFPTSVDDLVKEGNGVRFLRQAYKNPMNKKDGSWRFIYVTPAGQLIGSVRYTSLQQMAFLDKERQMGITTGSRGGSAAGESGSGANDSGGESSAQAPNQGVAASGGAPGSGSESSNTAPSASGGVRGRQPVQPFFSGPLQAQASANSGIATSESANSSPGDVIGGFIIGVAGKSDKRSIKVYKGGATYKEWEFIFNPLEQVQTIGVLSSGTTGQPAGNGAPFGTPRPPQPQPPQPPPQIPQ